MTLDAAPPCVHKVVPQETRYALAGKIGELAHPGTWFYDPAAHRLYVYSTDDPATHTVEAKRRTLGFDLTNTSHTTVAACRPVRLDGQDGRHHHRRHARRHQGHVPVALHGHHQGRDGLRQYGHARRR